MILGRWRGYGRILPVLFGILLLPVLPTGKALGQDKEAKVLTLDEALRIADERNKDIRKAKEYQNWVEGRYVEERAQALPQLQLSSYYSYNRDESLKALYKGLFPTQNETFSSDVSLTQPLYTFGKVAASIRAAKVGLATAGDQLRIARQNTRRDVSAAFYDVLLAKELHDLALQNLEQKARHFEEAHRKYSAGVATEYDVLAAEVDVENAKPEVIRRENEVRLSREKLRFLLGLEGEEVDARGELLFQSLTLPRYDEALKTAVDRRPELADLRKRVEIAKELVTIYDTGDKPRIDFKGGYGWKYIDASPFMGEGPAWTAGIFLSFPFFDGLRTQGKVAQAKSDVRTLRIDEAKLVDSISLQVRDALNLWREAGEVVQSISGNVRKAERLLSMANKGYEYGVKTKLEVDDANLNYIQAKGNLAKARRDYLVAWVNYEWVTGTLGETK
jgi:hydrophobic/amphiphilic exporter-1 (mainly G- bacteria), HAE1 family